MGVGHKVLGGLAVEPLMLCLDEPISGLDSFTADEVRSGAG